MQTSAPELSVRPSVSRAGSWSVRTAVIHAVALVLYPGLICGCHFHISALLLALLPIGWGFALIISYETWGERITAYVATVLSLGWIYLAWDSNVLFVYD